MKTIKNIFKFIVLLPSIIVLLIIGYLFLLLAWFAGKYKSANKFLDSFMNMLDRLDFRTVLGALSISFIVAFGIATYWVLVAYFFFQPVASVAP